MRFFWQEGEWNANLPVSRSCLLIMNIGALLMTALFMLGMFHATLFSMVWLRLPWWGVMVAGPVLGWGAVMLLVLALCWLRGLWWGWWNRRLSAAAPAWIVRAVGVLSRQVCKRVDDGQGL